MKATVESDSAELRLAACIDKYSPEIAKLARAAIAKMRARLPGAVELVYDNYNALAIAFGASERRADIIFSITLYPRWVSLFFTNAAGLRDAKGLLQGSGKSVRHIVLASAAKLDDPAVRELMRQALARAPTPIDSSRRRGVVIKSIVAKQRPRRPAGRPPAPPPRR